MNGYRRCCTWTQQNTTLLLKKKKKKNEIMPFEERWMELEIIILSEESQKAKDK